MNDATRDLARRVAAAAGREPVSVLVSEPGAQRAVETQLRAAGVRIAPASPLEVRVEVSANLRNHLLVAALRRGDERTVLISEWPRASGAAPPPPAAVTLNRRLLWRQDEPVLDAFETRDPEPLLLVLDTSRLTVYARRDTQWEVRQALEIPAPAPWPRDPRGRLLVYGASFQAFLPGTACRGTLATAPAMECKPGDSVWPLYSGSTLAGRAAFKGSRNFFEGPLTAEAGAYRALPPFYSAALAGTAQDPLWLIAGTDGRVSLYNAALEPAGALPNSWGEIAGLDAGCGSARQVLASRGGGSGPDAVQAWTIAGPQAAASAAAVEFPGPVTALWPSGAASATAVSRDPDTGLYAVYSLALACGP
jgi:hypothetical protein